ncbi:MAG TPA: protoporphyrinogen oxidase [Thermogutta sp.]|nr:protoporphyrinogen oxidase [Thermogutta sp.]
MENTLPSPDAPARPFRVAVIGAGISGLAAAWQIRRLRPEAELAVFEQQHSVGGVLGTVRENGFQVERSADNFITTLPWGVQLCRELALEDQLVTTHPDHRRAFVVWRGRLHPLPDGFLMMAPTRLWPLATTPLLSPLGKVRAAMEFFIPPRRDDNDESLAHFARRRLGREVYERLVEPLVSAVYGADMERLSVLATLSRFREMERNYGSLIRAMRVQMAQRRRAGTSRDGHSRESGARYSMFVTLQQGLQELVDRLAQHLPPGALRLGVGVTTIRRENDHWVLTLTDGHQFVGDAVVVATPAYAAAPLLCELDGRLAEELAAITYTGSVILAVAYRREAVGHPLHGSGCVIPRIEGSPLLAVSFSSQKYPHLAPKGYVLLRVFAGGARHPELVSLEDTRLVPLLRKEVERLLRIEGQPVQHWLFRWSQAMPQYEVNHGDRLRRIAERLAAWPGLALAGNAYRGVGIPHCIQSGRQAAVRALGLPVEDQQTSSSAF